MLTFSKRIAILFLGLAFFIQCEDPDDQVSYVSFLVGVDNTTSEDLEISITTDIQSIPFTCFGMVPANSYATMDDYL